MTDGNQISGARGGRSRTRAVHEVEAAFEDLHSHLRAAQREADELAKAREAAVEESLASLGSEVLWLDSDADVRLEWEGASNFEVTLTSDLDDLEAALGEFLDSGEMPTGLPTTVRRMDTSTGEIAEWDVEESLRVIRDDFIRTREGRAEQVHALRTRLDDSWRRTVDAIRTWVREPSGSTAEDWGRVQVAWRSALGLPGNKAAEILGISAPAVTRYEKGSRSPSLPYIESMVERIVAHGADLSPDMAVVFHVAEMYKVSAGELLGSMETNVELDVSVRDRFIELIDTLAIADVKLLTAIASSREAMSALHSLSADDDLAPLRRVLSGIGRERT